MPLAARQSPGHRADLIERGVHRFDLRAREVSVRDSELQPRTDLLGGASSGGESSASRSRIVSIDFGNVELDAIHRPMNLVEERLIELANDGKELPQPAR